jgi:hypothetical protein
VQPVSWYFRPPFCLGGWDLFTIRFPTDNLVRSAAAASNVQAASVQKRFGWRFGSRAFTASSALFLLLAQSKTKPASDIFISAHLYRSFFI